MNLATTGFAAGKGKRGQKATATGSPPAKVGSLTIGTKTSTTVAITWSAVGGAADYKPQWSLAGAGSWSTFDDGISTATGCTITSLTASTDYDFRVIASNAWGDGTPSDIQSASTPATPTVPGQVTGLATGTATATTMPLTWNAVSGATDYKPQWSLAGANSWTTFSDGVSTTPSATITGLTASTSYDFRVMASNAVGDGAASSTATASTAAAPASAITSNVALSRTSGVAPLFIFVDASATSSSDGAITDTFHQITHSFDFGETGLADWTYYKATANKNLHNGGPITGHIYETPGTYTFTPTHHHAGTGDKVGTPVTITVNDPATEFAGTASVLVNGTGSNDGSGPSGCTYAAQVGTPASNKRYLLKAGGSYNGFNVGGGGQSKIRIGRWGAGADPIVTGGIGIGGNATDSDICIADLAARGYVNGGKGHHLVRLRVNLTQPNNAIGFNFDETAPYRDMTYQACVDCSADDPGMATMIAGIWGCTAKTWIAGFYCAHVWQHEIRLPSAYKVAIEHSRLPYLNGYGGTGHSIKLHAQYSGNNPTVWDEASGAVNLASTFNVIGNNVLHHASSNGNWTCAVDPQNNSGSQIEGVSDVIIENNEFIRGTSGSSVDIVMGGRRITERGNSCTGGTFGKSTGVNSANIPTNWNGPYY